MMVEKTYNAALSAEAHAQPYECLREASTSPDLTKTRELAKILLDQYGDTNHSIKKWRKLPQFTISWTDHETKPPTKRTSRSLRFDWLVDHMVKHRGIAHGSLGLCPPEKAVRNWMDADLTLFAHYMPCNQAPEGFKFVLVPPLGNTFPVTPTIEREGFATSSPQLHLQRAVLTARERVIRESPAFVPQVLDRERGQQAQFMMGRTPPLAALMEFATLYVTLVDITLIQAYYAALYPPQGTSLTFDKAKMGSVTGRTIEDKLKWVRLVSGNDLNAPEELTAFRQVKAIRNHLTHFDPPCLAVSIDDVAGWLSKVPDLAWLLIKIRLCLGIPVSEPLVRMALVPPVLAIPRDPKHVRYPLPEDTGYASSTWKSGHPHRGRDPVKIPERLVAKLDQVSQRASQVLGRDCSNMEVITALLEQRVSELALLPDAEFGEYIGQLLEETTKPSTGGDGEDE